MTASYHLLVPLPRGRKSANLGFLSIYVVPRLQSTGVLSDWNTDWLDWPRVCNGVPGTAAPLQFDVAINGAVGPNGGLGPSAWTSPTPSSSIWRATFGTTPGQTPIGVERFSPVLRDNIDLHQSYDPTAIEAEVSALHQALADNFPSAPTSTQLSGLPEFGAAAGSSAAADYLDHIAPTTPFDEIDLSGEPSEVEADFHQALAYLQAHPELLRLLGLVIDVEVALPPASAGPLTVSVTSNYNRPDGTVVPLIIDVEPDFWPKEGAGSWPTIGDGSHAVSQFDLGSAVFGVGSAARGADAADADDPVEVPQPVDAGLSVGRTGDDLANEFSVLWANQKAFEEDILDWFQGPQIDPIPVPGSMLIGGRRYDVWDDDAGAWFSLWEREVPDGYRFPRDTSLSATPAQDEGWMTYTANTESASVVSGPVPPRPGEGQPLGPSSETTTIRVSPLLFSWKGWSLAADPPGRAFSGLAGPIDRAENKTAVDPDTGDEMLVQVEFDYEVPDGVLPRLRYTHEYKSRARTVDYAGNSRPLSASTDDPLQETPLIQFGRQSSLSAPIVVRREQKPVPGWGDLPLVMVIKSELDQDDSTVEPTSRIVFPGRTTQYQCELHGFPGPDGLPTSQSVFDDLVARTAASIENHTAEAPATGELVMDPIGTWSSGIDYLVEPAQVGYAFDGLPDSPAPAIVPLGTSWPQSETTSIELIAGPERTFVDTSSSEAVVTARLPKGVTRQAAVAGTIDGALLEHWKLWQNMAPAQRSKLQQQILDGGHWLFSSSTPITILHAVRRPLMIPAIQGTPTAVRAIGATTSIISGTFDVDVKSTDKLTVRATWTDPIDTPGAAGGLQDRTTGRWLFDQRENYAEVETASIKSGAAELGDTKRHEAVLSVEAFSRYARYFTERAIISFSGPTTSVKLTSDEAVATMNVTARHAGGDATQGVDFVVDGPAGRIQRTTGSTIPVGVNVVVEFIRLPINRMFDEEGQAPFPITFPNTGVPDPIVLVEVLPAFTRTPFGSGDGPLGTTHLGQTLRVWLRRPWFTTGVGELLGVVVGGSGPTTEFARDAMSPSGPSGQLGVADFPSATATRTGLPGGASVAGHEVAFDDDRQLWFADVAIDGDVGYRPFIKFALCRYQPVSVDGAHIGPVVVTGPVRLGANREASILHDGDEIEIAVVGDELGNEVTAFLQEADPDIADLDLRWRDLGDSVTLGAAADPGGVRWSGRLELPETDAELRVVIEDAEILTAQRVAGPADVRNVAYIETIGVPADWHSTTPTSTTSTTIPGGPGGVENLTARGGDRRVLLEWDAAPDNGNPISDYRIEQLNSTGSWVDTAVVPGARTRHVVRDLDNGVEVTFRVRGENSVGDGPWSAPASATPSAQAPGRVRRVRLFTGGGLVRVSWRPAASRGSVIDRYVVERRVAGGAWGSPATVSASTLELTIDDVAPGTLLGVRVRAENTVGAGAWSTPETVTVDGAGTVPDQVHGVTLLGGDRSLDIEWLDPDDGGSPLVHYEVQIRSDDGASSTRQVDASQLTLTVTGLTNGTTYTARVRAVNLIGAGAWSVEGVGVPQS